MGETGLALFYGSSLAWLAVADGRVIDGTAWLLDAMPGRTSGAAEHAARVRGATIRWVALDRPAEPFQPHLAGTRQIRRWYQEGEGHLAGHNLEFGQAPPGWFVADDWLECAFRTATATDAWAIVREMLGRGVWVRVPAGFGPRGEQRAVQDDPALPEGLSE